MTILSFVGKYLDKKRLHRIHALGFSYKKRSIIFLLPSGGGKTTLALRLLKESDFKLLSEDSPLVDRKGDIYPFPLRIGVTEEAEEEKISEEYSEKIERMEFGPKKIINIEHFFDSLGEASSPCLIFLGIRTLGNESKIERASLTVTYNEIFKNMVIGLGLYQGMEFLFTRKVSESMKLLPLMLSRVRNSMKLVKNSQTYKMFLGYNRKKNISTLIDFIKKNII